MQNLLDRADYIAGVYTDLYRCYDVSNQKAELKSIGKVIQLLEEVLMEMPEPTEKRAVQERPIDVMWSRLYDATSDAAYDWQRADTQELTNLLDYALRTAQAIVEIV